jgi:hypothetical protein
VDEVPAVKIWSVMSGIAMHAVAAEAISTAAIDMRRAEAAAMVGTHPSAMNGAAAKTATATTTKTAAAAVMAAMATAHFDGGAFAGVFG